MQEAGLTKKDKMNYLSIGRVIKIIINRNSEKKHLINVFSSVRAYVLKNKDVLSLDTFILKEIMNVHYFT